ncbi:MAG: putative flap endonuclease-1-like 5' DNA nuclease [Halobacteriales archaeon]|jgi:predicted flap endonuclease-1-like 5' DNA nuclease
MTLLDKLKSWLGLEGPDQDDEPAREVGVTVERSEGTPSPENEGAVKGTEDHKIESESESETSLDAEAPSETEEDQPPDQPAAETEPGEEVQTEDESEEAEDEAEPEETADVTDIKGIGPAYADRLGEAGIDSVADLAEADADELADATDISATRIQNWIDQAKVR